ncbi:RAMP superfamily protein [Nodosilinea sp. P-1105]|uniref:RAMP superfamily protein n=1 Tax=Nodosilinea sp. P-1105 TaxID=2546229 RepID=UPI00146C0D23|nr:RAMP superfamily protein [Nodosilinea sp. P-1105]NMF83544.1 RAMP superfamily protein [Nodosilinea sp. P-1105]
MTTDIADSIPQMFRAQTEHRCQLQRLKKRQEPHIIKWTDEWRNFVDSEIPNFDESVATRTYRIQWRLVSNSGQDEDLIRPVMGAGGWPLIPGSSMKGAFRRVFSAAQTEQRDRYCGKELENGDFRPGILRFHGGYPADQSWKNDLIDLTHPQQDWQVRGKSKSGGAFSVISLKQTALRFGISSTQPLNATEWDTIWQLWEQALAQGLGCRVSSGYGQFAEEAVASLAKDVLHETGLIGQGVAPILLGNGTPEIRPNIFKAALRGHALRLFGGFVAWDDSAEALVETLFGGVRGNGTQGLVALDVQWQRQDLREVDHYTGSPDLVTFYDVACTVQWRLARQPQDARQKQVLARLMQKLTEFAVVLGGFGKSWRRADHSIFRPGYTKHPIGCHWQWGNEAAQPIQSLADVTTLIDETRQAIWEWIDSQPKGFHARHEARLMQHINPPIILKSAKYRDAKTSAWREVWQPGRVEVWGRLSNGDSKVLDWLHDKSSYQRQSASSRNGRSGPRRREQRSIGAATQRYQAPKANIYRTTVSGYVGEEVTPGSKETRVGRIWHRMYPLGGEQAGKYLELLTFFPSSEANDSASRDFQTFLANQQEFQRLWRA